MKLKQLKLKNYRCYKEETIFDITDLICIIGRNDIGKSSLMEALNAFFNESVDKTDLCAYAEADDLKIEITCVFDDLPTSMVLDSSVECDLIEEGLLNLDNNLEIKRIYDFSGKTLSKSIYIIGNYTVAPELQGLLSKKISILKSYATELGIDLSDVNQRNSNEIRRAIRGAFSPDRNLQEIKVEGNLQTDDNLKNMWKVINSQLPIFSLFKMDKSLTDKDGDVQDPMKLAIEEALKFDVIARKLQEIELFVKQQTTDVADRTIKKIATFDKNLAEKLKSEFSKERKWASVFDLTLLNEENIPLNKRGSGIRRLVLLSFFQAQAEKRKDEKNAPSIIYAIEEPETSQHPLHQKEIIKNLIELSTQDNTQVLFTTHSANLVREIPIESLRYITRNKSGATLVTKGCLEDGSTNSETIESIIKALGILPNPTDKVKSLLYVEGNNDIIALKSYSQILFHTGLISEDIMNDDKVGVVISGGSSLKYYLENKYLEGLGKPEIHIYDNDKQEYRDIVRKINEENNPYKKAFNTSKLEMENFLCSEAIKEAYRDEGSDISLPNITDDADVPILVCKAFNSDWELQTSEKQKKKESKVKHVLNGAAVKKMTLERLDERNVTEELVGWFNVMIEFSKV